MYTPTKRILAAKKKLLKTEMLNRQIQDIESLRIFMEHHVFSVLDFMSLAKSIQHHFAKSSPIWVPIQDFKNARLINEIILCEETDINILGPERYLSHFEMYRIAMKEIGACTHNIDLFVEKMKELFSSNYKEKNIKKLLDSDFVPKICSDFMKVSFDSIKSKKIENVVSTFTFGRETIIPEMFIKVLENLQISKSDAPMLYYYLERHIEVDTEEHGPAAMELVQSVIKDEISEKNVEKSALKAINARRIFWEGINEEINKR